MLDMGLQENAAGLQVMTAQTDHDNNSNEPGNQINPKNV